MDQSEGAAKGLQRRGDQVAVLIFSGAFRLIHFAALS
jgi:hypothetical protein